MLLNEPLVAELNELLLITGLTLVTGLTLITGLTMIVKLISTLTAVMVAVGYEVMVGAYYLIWEVVSRLRRARGLMIVFHGSQQHLSNSHDGQGLRSNCI